ncbi:HD domain-containing protein [Sneathiella chinensis]|uniref:Phosphodiesterase n=1 Tax=Sneathiella chinensis TaxID=349750 RepID=A0ABQ5U4H6_9PROT|nr:HD domain-containing protein [Sneathiella chinensis]GLQ06743.1 phosphodiesterase [Sneathiella chinensis]
MTITATSKPALNAETIVPFIGDIFKRRGADSYLGEQVTMSEHMLQAAQLAEKLGASDEAIAAALLHDIGHYTSEFPADAIAAGQDNFHEQAGADLLAAFFPAAVTDCIRHHVAAKRYLCAVNPDYFNQLSEASVQTLRLQGGPMSEDEAAAFAKLPNLDLILQVRYWDDAAKMKNKKTPDFDYYAPVLQRLVEAHEASRA